MILDKSWGNRTSAIWYWYSNSGIHEVGGSSHINNDYYESYVGRMADMVDDAIMANQNVKEDESSTCQEPFYNIV